MAKKNGLKEARESCSKRFVAHKRAAITRSEIPKFACVA